MSSQNVHNNHFTLIIAQIHAIWMQLLKEQLQWGWNDCEEQEHNVLTALTSTTPAHTEEAAI